MRYAHTVRLGLMIALAALLIPRDGIAPAMARDCNCARMVNGACVPDPTCNPANNEPAGGSATDSAPPPPPAPTSSPAPAPPRSPAPPRPSINAGAPPPVKRGSSGWGSRTGSEITAPDIAHALRHRSLTRGLSVPTILETGFKSLSAPGAEEAGYGLYSYAILPKFTPRATIFLNEVFKEIPSINETAADPDQLNVLYVPLRSGKQQDFDALFKPDISRDKAGATVATSLYDYKMARGVLDHICTRPAANIRDLCSGDLSRGPYIFTYASAASKLTPVDPPYLFIDMSDIHEKAFGELIAAFQAQVKREDMTDGAKIHTLRLGLLQIALKASDWLPFVQKAMADIVYTPGDGDKKK